MPSSHNYSHLTHIASRDELRLYELIPSAVWVFDLDKHGWWWGNSAAIEFWGLQSLQELIDKDLSEDTQGARDRTQQTFELAAEEGLTVDPWTTYPKGEPHTLLMKHRAVLLGPERHRGIIAFINERVNLGELPDNLLLMEAMRYTRVPTTTFTQEGVTVVENPAATQTYPPSRLVESTECPFVARFADPEEGRACLEKIKAGAEGRWDYVMQTSAGQRRHSLDIRRTRHPLNGDYLFLVVEYDFTERFEALQAAEAARTQLHDMAMKDALTGAHSLHYMQDAVRAEINRAKQHKQELWLMFVDLDGFKLVNDSFGHTAGDMVLREVAERIQTVIREDDLLARIGGDEYAVLLSSKHNETNVREIAARIVEALEQPVGVYNHQARVSASVGIAHYPGDGNSLDALLKAADKAMYHVKKTGKNGFLFAQGQ
ncbi:MAG: diguanylate cyclase [Pseudohongiellaceae bacterium]|nr:diguanylate cyclase [Pseudohongiellaceae bacterium]